MIIVFLLGHVAFVSEVITACSLLISDYLITIFYVLEIALHAIYCEDKLCTIQSVVLLPDNMASANDSLLMARLKQKYSHHSRNWDAVVRELKTGYTVDIVFFVSSLNKEISLWLHMTN